MTTANDVTKDVGPRSFGVVISNINEGTLHSELSEKLQWLARVLEAHALQVGKAKGTLTLKLNLTVDHLGVATVQPEVTIKEPKPLRGAAVFWLDKASNLQPQNPNQTVLPLREVTKNNEPVRDIGAAHQDIKNV